MHDVLYVRLKKTMLHKHTQQFFRYTDQYKLLLEWTILSLKAKGTAGKKNCGGKGFFSLREH